MFWFLNRNYFLKSQWQHFPFLSMACAQDKSVLRRGGSTWGLRSLMLWFRPFHPRLRYMCTLVRDNICPTLVEHKAWLEQRQLETFVHSLTQWHIYPILFDDDMCSFCKERWSNKQVFHVKKELVSFSAFRVCSCVMCDNNKCFFLKLGSLGVKGNFKTWAFQKCSNCLSFFLNAYWAYWKTSIQGRLSWHNF